MGRNEGWWTSAKRMAKDSSRSGAVLFDGFWESAKEAPEDFAKGLGTYADYYTPGDFWRKIKDYATKIGRQGLYNAMLLYYALQQPQSQVPLWAKGVIIGALGYFIIPVDMIPDVVPGVGLTDDLGILAAALAVIAMHIPPEAKEQARKRLRGQGSSPPYPGALVISLDFELHWGLMRTFSLESLNGRLLETRNAIPHTLRLFESFGIHATWAVVGFLFFRTKDDLLAALPVHRPQLNGHGPSPYEILSDLGPDEERDPYHYASSLVDQIIDTPNQEIATHTFSHCIWDQSTPDLEAFRSDLKAALETARSKLVHMASIVFPRNKYSAPLLHVLREEKTMAFRGVRDPWYTFLDRGGKPRQTLFRVFRFLDHHVPVSGSNSYGWNSIASGPPYDVPASFGLEFYYHRPWLDALEHLRLKRITSSLTKAAERQEIFHLWWHPHQLGHDLHRKLEFLRRILHHYALLRDTHGMESLTMREVAERRSLLAAT